MEQLVERLLASTAYGERWGRHWLDVIRFGESDGYERNNWRHKAWPYRDYVIRAFNANKPFDTFVREQLAGDLGPAIRASCAIPGVFTPVEDIKGRTLVDGGVVAPVPTRAVREMGAEIIIAIDVLAGGSTKWGKPKSLVGVVFQAAMMLIRTASKLQDYHADVTILPKVGHIRIDDLSKMDELIAAGEEAAREKIDEIEALITAKVA